MKKTSVLALVAALAIPVGIVATESVASAAPMSPERVQAYGRDILAHARALYTEGNVVARMAHENAKLAHEGWNKSAQIHHNAHAIALDAIHLIGDENMYRASMLCLQAHRELPRFHSLENAANYHASQAAHYELLARQDHAEATRLRAHAGQENDPVAKARLMDAARDLDGAATRDDNDGRRERTESQRDRAAASAIRADATAKEQAANRMDPNLHCSFN